jgi:D-ribose pyranase
MVVVAGRDFPIMPGIETVDIALVDGVPTVLQVLEVIRSHMEIGCVFMGEGFPASNPLAIRSHFFRCLYGVMVIYIGSAEFQQHAAGAIGGIRTGETLQCASMLLVSGPSASFAARDSGRPSRETGCED